LRSIDFFPANGTPSLFYTILAINFIDVTLIVSQAILVDSMIADVVEESELRTGRRSEGVFFAARSLVRKSVSGVGVVMATTLLTIIQFPEDAVPGEVDPKIIFNLGTAYAPLIFTLYMSMLLVMFSYRISQTKHEANLEQLARRDVPG
jgi:Na+/melibiose symporter-like transporter